MSQHTLPTPEQLQSYWMPFTSNRRFKKNPILLKGAKGMHYQLADGRSILDATAGLWCVNAGHCHPRITEAIREQAGTLDYAPSFQLGHQGAFDFTGRLAEMAPGDLNHVFLSNSGSEAVDTALKIALAYHRARGEHGRVRLIGRERAYHGVGFGGISVGGHGGHRKAFGNLLHSVDHIGHTYDRSHMAFSRGQPDWGVHMAEEFARKIALHDPSTIAALIVEPVAGSTGVLVPPRGYLERLRALCDQHGILLIFDEVITGFGRLGTSFGADYFGVQPDIMTLAKGLTNGAAPMGATIVSTAVHEALMQGPAEAIELAHGYTYSGHPLSCAAGLATLDVYRDENIFAHAVGVAGHWEKAAHSLKGLPHVADIRNIGLLAAIELEAVPGRPGKRAYECHLKCLEAGVLVRAAGDSIVLSPPLIISPAQIDEVFACIADVLPTIE